MITRAQHVASIGRRVRALGILTALALFTLALFLAGPVRAILLSHYGRMIGPSSAVPWPTHALVLPLLGLTSSPWDPFVFTSVWAGVLTGPLLLLLLAVRSSHHTLVRVWSQALGLYLALLLLVGTVLGFFMWLPFARLGCGLARTALPHSIYASSGLQYPLAA